MLESNYSFVKFEKCCLLVVNRYWLNSLMKAHLGINLLNILIKMNKALSRRAAYSILANDALIITAGAGMSADSGLPTFRGNQGFWKAYP